MTYICDYKKTSHMGIGLLLTTVLTAMISACGAVDSGAENNQVISEQSNVPYLAEQISKSSFIETTDEDSETDTSTSLQAYSMTTDELENFLYWLYTPENPAENMPLIVYLHGASGRGKELDLVVSDEDFPRYLKLGELGYVRAYVLIPQLPSEMRGWSNICDSLYSLIQKTVSEYSIDKNNISLAGFSMGGTATWEFAAEYPDLFARIAPLSGSARGVLDQITALQDIPAWAFVGSADTVIAPNSSEQMIAELKRAGATAKITVFDGADHASVPSLTYLDENIHLVDWLLGKTE